MLFQDLIVRKRDGGALTESEIAAFVRGAATGDVPAEQLSALLMAIFFRGMSFEEASGLTRAMAHSGTVIDWSSEGLDGPVVDKHSTGGIGDKVSLMLAPIAAACGLYVPMISGRGLGHTGGTLDKLEAIPGYDAVPGLDRFKAVVRQAGCAIVGQTADLAPADKRLYAIRDVTGTVESIPLITASILSKKVAAGLQGLVMDIKTGAGAFMKDYEASLALARSLIGTGAALGLPTHALITDMNQPLGLTIGNAVEVAETVAYLKGAREPRLDEVVLELAAEMLILGRVESEHGAARARAEAALTSGRAAEVFARMVAALGGPADFLDRSEAYLRPAPVVRPVFAGQEGYLAGADGRAIGNAVVEMGGGRRKVEDKVDHAVGFTAVAALGTRVGPDQPLAMVHAATTEAAELAARRYREACVVTAEGLAAAPVVYERLTTA
jgi:thymidine phosphorylase